MSKLSKKKVIGITGSMGSGKSEISRYLRKKYPVLDCDQVNADLLKKGNLGYQKLNDFLKWNPNKYQIIYDRLFDRKFDCTKINKFINTSNFISVREGLTRCLKVFLTSPKFKNINWKKESLKDQFVKERTPLKEICGIKNKIKYIIFRI